MKYKSFLKIILFTALSLLISALLTSQLRELLSGIFGEKGARPTIYFFIQIGIIQIIMKALFAVAYILMGQKIPIKNTYLRAFVFVLMFLSSDYFPQILGIAGADGPISEAGLNIPIIISDSFGFLLDGILLGLIFKSTTYSSSKCCTRIALIKTSVISAVIFPSIVAAFDQIVGHIYSPLYCYNIMQVSKNREMMFDIIFYGCFIATGALLPIFYRITEYNSEKSSSERRFGLIYSVCIWTPVVSIMVAFGTNILSTFLYIIVFIIFIVGVSIMNGKLLKLFNSERLNKLNI